MIRVTKRSWSKNGHGHRMIRVTEYSGSLNSHGHKTVGVATRGSQNGPRIFRVTELQVLSRCIHVSRCGGRSCQSLWSQWFPSVSRLQGETSENVFHFLSLFLSVLMSSILQVCATYMDGFRATAVCPVGGPRAAEKARRTADSIIKRCGGQTLPVRKQTVYCFLLAKVLMAPLMVKLFSVV